MKEKLETIAIQAGKSGEKVEFVLSGEDYFNRLHDLITNAHTEIHIQTYIFEDDHIGHKVAEALIEAAKRKVKIYILVDSYGSKALTNKFIHELSSHGINFRIFSPLFSRNNIYLGRRLHHKVIVIDSEYALIGGINIADKYHGTERTSPWLDFAVLLDGELVKSLNILCRNIYFQKKRIKRLNIKPDIKAHDTSVRVIQNDWLKRKNEIGNTYLRFIRGAKNDIIIVGSYFIPGRRIRTALKRASKRGAKIKIILAGISDVPLVKQATTYLYSSLLRQNIELYEWNKSILHGKAAVVDECICTIGSFNLNHLSSYGSIEMNVEIHSTEFSSKFNSYLSQIIEECDKITPQSFKKKNRLLNRIGNFLAFYIVRIILVTVTYLPYKRAFKNLL